MCENARESRQADQCESSIGRDLTEKELAYNRGMNQAKMPLDIPSLDTCNLQRDLRVRRSRLEAELSVVNKAIEAMNENPEIGKIIEAAKLLNQLGYRIR